MPVIVDEVVISIEVTNQAAGGASAGSAPTGGTPGAAPAAADHQALVAECVERVLEILRRKSER